MCILIYIGVMRLFLGGIHFACLNTELIKHKFFGVKLSLTHLPQNVFIVLFISHIIHPFIFTSQTHAVLQLTIDY